MIFSTILSAPAAPEPGARGLNWWALLAGGTALALIGVPPGLALEAPGGLLTAIGGGVAIVGGAFGFPATLARRAGCFVRSVPRAWRPHPRGRAGSRRPPTSGA